MVSAEDRLSALRDDLLGVELQGTDGVRFYVRSLLGEGGQGWIYKGNYDERDGIPIVIKFLRPDVMSEDALRRFRREAEVLRRLGAQRTPNPNIVRFYDHGTLRMPLRGGPVGAVVDLPFTVLEYVDGATLGELLEKQGGGRGLPVSRVRRILRQVARALSAVHAQNIIHRDLKPSNVLVSNEGGTEIGKVTDFGLAKVTELGMTRTQILAGVTLGYAPPEQFESGNQRVSVRSDVFSFATILFEALTGVPAFVDDPRDNALVVVGRMLTGPRPSLAKRAAKLSPELSARPDAMARLDAELGRAMAAEPESRHASVQEFWDAVEPVLRVIDSTTGEPLRATPAPGGPRARSIQPSVEAWTFRPLAGLPKADTLRLSALLAGGETAVGVGARGVYMFHPGQGWSTAFRPSGLQIDQVRGVLPLLDGGALLVGDQGLTAALTTAGRLERWQLVGPEHNLYGGFVDSSIFLVGEKRGDVGVCLFAATGQQPQIREIPEARKLHAACRLLHGAVLACGAGGSLLRVDTPTIAALPWSQTGELLAIAAQPDGGAVAVGTGGHALFVTSTLQARLEPVQTTQDLCAVGIGRDGTPWAGGQSARLLLRQAAVWARVQLPAEVKGTILAVGATSTGAIHVVTSEGLMVEGTGPAGSLGME